MLRRFLLMATVVAAALLLLVACGGQDATPTPTAVPPLPTAAPTEPPAPAAEPTVAPEATAAETSAEAAATAAETPAAESAAPVEESAAATPAAEANAPAAESAAPATAGALTVTSARTIDEVIGVNDPVFAAVSPNGEMIVFAQQEGRGRNKQRELCIYSFENAGLKCSEAPENYLGYPVSLVWSPDSAYVVFTENPVTLGDESDIWVLDVANGTITDRTDDGVTGSYTTAAPGTALIDYMPSFSADGMIYFWRVVPQGDQTFTMGLYRIAPTEGDAESLGDMTSDLNGQLILYDTEVFFLDGMSAVSPDGSKVAALFTSPFADPMTAQRNSLFVLEIADGKVTTANKLADFDTFQEALPTFQYSPASPSGLAWTADGQGVVVAAVSPDTNTPLVLFYYVDVATGTTTPVVDFSSYTDYDAFFQAPDGGIPPRYYSPWTGSLSAAGDRLLMLSDLAGVTTVFDAPLPPTGDLPIAIGTTGDAEVPISSSVRSSRSIDGKVLMYQLLLTVVPEE